MPIVSRMPHFIFKNEPPFFPDNLKPDQTGLVALGGTLDVPILLEAYSKGIFPWSGEDPIPWYSPDPRLVLFPENFHLSKSLKKLLIKGEFKIKFDNDFISVIKACQTIKRPNQHGTWINNNIIKSYTRLFDQNVAHCIEVYFDNQLCGGLYGLSLGRLFFGESMFSQVSNASKIALHHLVEKSKELGLLFIDCQQVTPHMLRMGAVPLPRNKFLTLLNHGLSCSVKPQQWKY